MDIPKLKKSNRPREYKLYTDKQRYDVVYQYLFENKSHRYLDNTILGLDMHVSKGYQSMGILHYLGLIDLFKGLFSNLTVNEAIEELQNSTNDDYTCIANLLLKGLLDSNVYNQDIEMESCESYQVEIDGKKTEYYVTRYERNPKNRERAIKIHGLKCMACNFDYENTYGERGKDYIEVHHIIPLSSVESEIEIDPLNDLIVVCSNCHRMIHRKRNDILKLEELRKVIFEHK